MAKNIRGHRELSFAQFELSYLGNKWGCQGWTGMVAYNILQSATNVSLRLLGATGVFCGFFFSTIDTETYTEKVSLALPGRRPLNLTFSGGMVVGLLLLGNLYHVLQWVQRMSLRSMLVAAVSFAAPFFSSYFFSNGGPQHQDNNHVSAKKKQSHT